MLDLARLENQRLRATPWGQLAFAQYLRFSYRFPRRTEIVIEGTEHLDPERRYIVAMNHTDRYNFWPFQFGLYSRRLGFTTVWVKGKYYENRLIGGFMDAMGSIPMPSRGYVIATEYRRVVGRAPENDEYRALRSLADGGPAEDSEALARLGDPQAFFQRFDDLYDRMIAQVMRLHEEAVTNGLHVLVFPQGTRSKRLSRGHIGLAQVAQHLDLDVVPVGCNGCDRAYPGNSPFAKGGRIVYRIGEPLRVDGPALGPHRVTVPFRPFSTQALADHGEAFRAATDVVMDHINALLDPEYRYSEDQSSDGVSGMRRFV